MESRSPKSRSPETDPLIGTLVGTIRVQERIGAGGMGTVYGGFDETLQRRVALKSIRRSLGIRPELRARFLREARVLSRLEHPNICRIHGYLDEGGRAFLVMERIDGENLGKTLDRLTPTQRLDIAIQIVRVLSVAHEHGIVHRDLKPDNVMLTADHVAKVLDFGLARMQHEEPEPAPAPSPDEPSQHDALSLRISDMSETTLGIDSMMTTVDDLDELLKTRAGAIVGTPFYMSPEQARGEQVTTASDMFSFGLLLHTLFTGDLPYPNPRDRMATLRQVARGESALPVGLDRELTRLIQQLKSPPAARRPTAEAALERLCWIRDRPKRRRRAILAVVVVTALVLAAAKYTLDLRHERLIAEQRREQAESLISFMVGDLRDKLVPLGRLDVLDDVGVKAQEYFASVPAAELSVDELLRRAEVLAQLGDVRTTQGDLTGALSAFEESLELTEDLSARDPADMQRRLAVGTSHFWVGTVHWYRNELDAAHESFARYLQSARDVAATDPTHAEWQMELAHGHGNMAQILEAEGRVDEAIGHLKQRRAVLESLLERDPANDEWRLELASTHLMHGMASESAGDLRGALAEFRADAALMRQLVDEQPSNAPWRERLATSHSFVGSALAWLGELRSAEEQLRQAVALAAELLPGDPTNVDWQELNAMTSRMLGRTLGYQSRQEEGRPYLDRALVQFEGLMQANPDDPRWAEQRAVVLVERAQLHASSLRWGAALADADEAITALSNEDVGSWLAAALLVRSNALNAAAQIDEATVAAQRACDVAEQLGAGSVTPRDLGLRARALENCGRQVDAAPLITRMTAVGIVDPLRVSNNVTWRTKR